MDWSEIGKWVLAALAVVAAAGFAFKFVVNLKSSNIVQKGNTAGGDIVAGNKTSNSHNKR